MAPSDQSLPDFRLLFESTPGLNLVLTTDFTIVTASNTYLRATMRDREQLVGLNIFEAFPDNPDDAEATGVRNLRASLDRVLTFKVPDRMAVQKYDMRRPDSEGGGFEERYWSPINWPVIGANGEVAYIIHRVEDVTAFIRQAEAGAEQEKRTESLQAELYHQTQDVAEANRQLRAANQTLAQLYERIARLMARPEDDWKSGADVAPEEMLARVSDLLEGHSRLEAELRQSQKMEAVGRLAGGIAHDFNNELTVIVGYCALVLGDLSPKDPTYGRLKDILDAGERAASLTRQLLAFSRKQVLQPRVVNLASTLEEMGRMLRRVLGEDIEIATMIDSDLGAVEIDPGQIQQVIMNLVVNARDAMPRGGKLTLELRNIDLREAHVHSHDVPPGRYVMLAVSDTGVGMTPETQQRVFEPFFTTKDVGVGTGLGLSTVYGIVKQSGGHIWLYSEPGLGATFKIFLRRIEDHPVPLPARPSLEIARGSATILLVEDNAVVRSLVQETLTSAGYKVLSAADGEEALTVSAAHAGAIQLLLSDVVMRKMGGRQVAERLTALRPGIKVLFMSGYTGDAIVHHGILGDAGSDFIQKPFTPAALCAKVQSVLDLASRSRRILVVDDEEPVRRLIASMLEDSGYQVVGAADAREARARTLDQPVDMMITDLSMPEEDGIEFIRDFRKQHPQVKIIAVSGAFGPEVLDAAKLLGADAALAKPLRAEDLIRRIESLW